MMNENNNYSINHIKTTTNEKNYCWEIMQLLCRDTIITWKSVSLFQHRKVIIYVLGAIWGS